jgi:hypothetical protein
METKQVGSSIVKVWQNGDLYKAGQCNVLLNASAQPDFLKTCTIITILYSFNFLISIYRNQSLIKEPIHGLSVVQI